MNPESRLRYQEIYINYLEGQILRRMTLKEKEEQIDFESDDILPILYKYKINSLRFLVLELEKLLHKKNIFIDIEEKENPCPYDYPNEYILRKSATIFFKEDPILNGNQVILKCLDGKDSFGCALYLDNPNKLTREMLGYLIEKMFYDLLPLKFKHLEEKNE